MNYKRVIGTLMLAALAVGLTATRAAANEVYKGKFDLPTAAYWGGALLQPGQYTISVYQDFANAPEFFVQGEGINAAFFTGKVISERTSQENYLRLEEINGVSVVRALDAGILGKSFAFPVPKNIQSDTVQSSEAQPTAVPVSSGF